MCYIYTIRLSHPLMHSKMHKPRISYPLRENIRLVQNAEADSPPPKQSYAEDQLGPLVHYLDQLPTAIQRIVINSRRLLKSVVRKAMREAKWARSRASFQTLGPLKESKEFSYPEGRVIRSEEGATSAPPERGT